RKKGTALAVPFQLAEEGSAFFGKGDRAPLRASVVRQRRTIRHSAPRAVFSATYTPPPKMVAAGPRNSVRLVCRKKGAALAVPFLIYHLFSTRSAKPGKSFTLILRPPSRTAVPVKRPKTWC